MGVDNVKGDVAGGVLLIIRYTLFVINDAVRGIFIGCILSSNIIFIIRDGEFLRLGEQVIPGGGLGLFEDVVAHVQAGDGQFAHVATGFPDGQGGCGCSCLLNFRRRGYAVGAFGCPCPTRIDKVDRGRPVLFGQGEFSAGQVYILIVLLGIAFLIDLDAVGVDSRGVVVGLPGKGPIRLLFIGVVVVVEVGGVLVAGGIAGIVHNINLFVGGGGVGDNQFGVTDIAVILEFVINKVQIERDLSRRIVRAVCG